MAGFSIDGFMGRVPCPHCEKNHCFCELTDCCGIDGVGEGSRLICIHYNKVVSAAGLERQAKKHNLTRYNQIDENYGWKLQVITDVFGKDFYKKGEVELYNLEYGARGTCPNLDVAKQFVANHRGNLSAYYGD